MSPSDTSSIPKVGHGEGILVVDDNETNLLVLTGMLRHMGFTPHPARDALSALEAVEKTTGPAFAAILMDCYMPRLDGFEAARLIRGTERAQGLSRTPIVAVSAAALGEDRERALRAGMDDFVAKPVDPTALARTLLALLRRSDSPVASAEHAGPVLGLFGETVLREIHDAYRAEIQRVVPVLRAAGAAGDATSLRDAAHSIKGASLSVGSEAAAALAARVEEQARQGMLGDVEELIEELVEELERQHRRMADDGTGVYST